MKDAVGHWIFRDATTVALNAADPEAQSIANADIFGEQLFSDTHVTMSEPFEPSEGNPFANYLNKLATELDRPGIVGVEGDGLSYGFPLKFPDYDICGGDLDSLTNGSLRARTALEVGDARVSQIPAELLAESAGDERATWLEGRLSRGIKNLTRDQSVVGISKILGTKAPDEREAWEELVKSIDSLDFGAEDGGGGQ